MGHTTWYSSFEGVSAMTRINTNVSSLIAQKTLARSNADLQTALNRLSTGLRINTGKDDPAGLIASENLRRDITTVEKAISNSERANQLIATADSALGQVSNLLNDIRGLVTEAANSGALSDEQIAANQLQVDSSLEAIDRIAQVTTFQGRKLLDGNLDFVTTAGAGFSTVQDLNIDQANLGTAGSIAVSVDIQAAATQASITSNFNARGAFAITDGTTTLNFEATRADDTATALTVTIASNATTTSGNVDASFSGDTLTLTFDTDNNAVTAAQIQAAIDGLSGAPLINVSSTGTGTIDGNAVTTGSNAATITSVLADSITFQLAGADGSEVFSFQAGATAAQLEAAIDLVSDATGVTASLSGTNNRTITLNTSAYGSDAYVEVDVISEGTNGDFGSSLSATRATGTDISALINGTQAKGTANTLSINTATLDLSLTVNAGSSTDVAFTITGGGAVFQLGPEVVSNQQVRLGIQSINTGSLGGPSGRLYELRSGQARDLSTDATTAAKIVDEVITQVVEVRGRLGAFQRTTLDSNIASLNDTISNLSEAESSIRDADFARETAALTRAQILVQSGTSVLQISNQNPQNVLALLR